MTTIKKLGMDVILIVVLFFLAVFSSYNGGLQLNTRGVSKSNVWFQADVGRVNQNMTERESNHYRSKVHPIFSLATAPIIHVVNKLGMEKEQAVRGLVAIVTGIWLSLFYALLRILKYRVFDSFIFTSLAGVSAATIFWTVVPETFLFGSLTILLALALTAMAEIKSYSSMYYVVFSALSLSMTVTNWMSGIAATLANHSFKKTFRITVDAFALVTILWAIQHAIFPTSEFFLWSAGEQDYILVEEAGGVLEKARVFFSHSIVMPEIQILPNRWAPTWPFFSVQFSTIGSSGLLGLITTIGWGILLMSGVLSALRGSENKKFKMVLALILTGQFLLHMIYGDETFLYSIHWAPLLILVATFGLGTKYRPYILFLAVLVFVGMAINNLHQFKRVSTELWKSKYETEVSQRESLHILKYKELG